MITLYKGDCLELLKTIPDNSIDMILTDPPYNISQNNFCADKSKFKSAIMRRNKAVNFDFGAWDNMDREEFLEFTKQWLLESIRVLRNGGCLISFFNKEDISYLGLVAMEHGMRTRTIFTWHKTNPVPSFRKCNYLSACEYAWIGSKGDKTWTFNFGLQKEMHNFFETCNSSGYKKTDHPTEKPESMIEHLVKIHTNENDTILDCFMGSGTSGVACVHLNRNFIGIEKDEHYFQVAKERIEKEQAESLF